MARRGSGSLDALADRVAALERSFAGIRSRLEALEHPAAPEQPETAQPPVASSEAPHEPIADEARDTAHEPEHHEPEHDEQPPIVPRRPGHDEPEDGGTW